MCPVHAGCILPFHDNFLSLLLDSGVLCSKALVQFDGERYVIEIAGQIGLYLSYVIDPINPKMKAMTWTFYDSSAQYATLLIFNIIRPIPQRIMVAVSFTNVSTVQSISPRQKRPSWKV